MFEPQFLPERYANRRRGLGTPVRDALARAINGAEVVVTRAMVRPAKSAVVTLALGVLVGALVRVAFVRHSGPNQAAAADRTATMPADTRPSP